MWYFSGISLELGPVQWGNIPGPGCMLSGKGFSLGGLMHARLQHGVIQQL